MSAAQHPPRYSFAEEIANSVTHGIGIVLKFVLRGRRHGLIVALYLGMGWLVVVATKPLLETMGAGGMAFLAGGGLAYTVGVIFYKWRQLPYSQAIWHGFVLLGGGLHYFGVLLYLIP